MPEIKIERHVDLKGKEIFVLDIEARFGSLKVTLYYPSLHGILDLGYLIVNKCRALQEPSQAIEIERMARTQDDGRDADALARAPATPPAADTVAQLAGNYAINDAVEHEAAMANKEPADFF